MSVDIIKKSCLRWFVLENWLCFSIFLLPTYLIKINIFGLPTNVWEAMVAIGFFWWLLDKKFVFERVDWLKYKTYFFPLVLIFTGLFVGMLLNANYRMGLGIIKGWFLVPLVFIFIASEVLDNAKTRILFQFFYLSALAVSIIAIFYWFCGWVTFDARLQSFFNSPNYLAMYLSPAIIIGTVFFREKKFFYASSLILIAASFYLTFSFAAWAAVIVSILIIFFLIETKNGKRGVTMGIILFILFSFFTFEFGSEKSTSIVSLDSRSSLSSRIMIWKTSEKLIQDNFLWGIGPGNFQNKYLEYQKFYPPFLEWAVPHPHNIFLAFWLYSGLIGLIGFLVLLEIFFKRFFEKQKNALKFMALGIMLVIIIHGLFDTTYFKNDLAVIFWLAYFGMIKGEK